MQFNAPSSSPLSGWFLPATWRRFRFDASSSASSSPPDSSSYSSESSSTSSSSDSSWSLAVAFFFALPAGGRAVDLRLAGVFVTDLRPDVRVGTYNKQRTGNLRFFFFRPVRGTRYFRREKLPFLVSSRHRNHHLLLHQIPRCRMLWPWWWLVRCVYAFWIDFFADQLQTKSYERKVESEMDADVLRLSCFTSEKKMSRKNKLTPTERKNEFDNESNSKFRYWKLRNWYYVQRKNTEN